MSRPPGGRWRARPAVAVLVALLAWSTLGAGVAGADEATPSNFTSEVVEVRPDVDGVTVRVDGGDSFLTVSARPGVVVEVPGYDGEPYLRIGADGRVEVNRRSPAHALNLTRTGSGGLPDEADSGAEPRWVATGEVGSASWHDHRIHWMLSEPPVPGRGGFVQRWTVPIEVDGTEVTVSGELRYHDDDWAGAALSVALGVLAAIGTWLLGRSRDGARRGWSAASLVVAAGLGVWASAAAFASNPPGAGASLLPVALCVTALLTAALAPLIGRPWPLLASVALLAGWALVRIGVLWKPVLPTTLPDWADRSITAVVLGVAVGALDVTTAPRALRTGTPSGPAAAGGDDGGPA